MSGTVYVIPRTTPDWMAKRSELHSTENGGVQMGLHRHRRGGGGGVATQASRSRSNFISKRACRNRAFPSTSICSVQKKKKIDLDKESTTKEKRYNNNYWKESQNRLPLISLLLYCLDKNLQPRNLHGCCVTSSHPPFAPLPTTPSAATRILERVASHTWWNSPDIPNLTSHTL